MPPKYLFVETNFDVAPDTELPISGAWKKDLPVLPDWQSLDWFERSQWQSKTQSMTALVIENLDDQPSSKLYPALVGEITDRKFIDWLCEVWMGRSDKASHAPEPGILFPRSYSPDERPSFSNPSPRLNELLILVSDHNYIDPETKRVGIRLSVHLRDDAKHQRRRLRRKAWRAKISTALDKFWVF